MNTLIASAFTVFLLALSIVSANADETDELRNAVTTFYAALNKGDVTSARNYILPDGFTEFSSRGGELLYVDADVLEKMFASGLTVNVALEKITARVYGDSGYVTFHRIGTIDRGGANKPQDKDARTSMYWVNQGSKWYLAHLHNSNLNP